MSSSLESILAKIALGEREHFDFALSLLSSDLLITPVTLKEDTADSRQTKTIRVVTLAEAGKKVIPTFTSEDYLFQWGGRDYQSFSVPGADLALSLPRDAHLRINPGQTHSIELSPAEVLQLSQTNALLRQEEPAKGEIEAPILEDLRRLLVPYEEVTKAYFVSLPNEESEAVLGLVTEAMTPDKRFLLMADVAETSRHYFGAAGAMDVYDDEDFQSLNARNIFDNLQPFYLGKERPLKKKPAVNLLKPQAADLRQNVLHERNEPLTNKR